MPGLEGGVHITVIFVDRFRLQGRGSSSRLPRALKVPSRQLITGYERPCISPPPLLRDYHPAIGRLRSLSIEGTPENLQDITAHLSHPAPLLKKLSICGGYNLGRHPNPALTPALFNGDLSSLRELCLESVRTQLLWRNMANLTSFTLGRTSPGGATVRQILDFFKSAPLLREVNFYFATPTSSGRDCKLVSLACLKRMRITGGGSASLLLDHLLIPIGADLVIEVDLPGPPINDHPQVSR